MSYIMDVTCNVMRPSSLHKLTALSDSHQLSEKEIRVLQRLYSQQSVVMQPHTHEAMLRETLKSLMIRHPDLREGGGLVIYAKTQTHNTLFDHDWMDGMLAELELTRWSGFALSMNHCASGLSALHLASRLHDQGDERPIIVLCGEKSIAPFNKMSVAALGEMATACLVHPTQGSWRITGSEVAHFGAFYASPEKMTQVAKRALIEMFYPLLCDFLQRQTVPSDAAILPYNLNLPVLKRLALDCGWHDRLYVSNLTSLGHTFCSDVFINFITSLEKTDFNHALMFAAGMGMTFSAVHLERHTH
ncbi:TPA: hypothetical protein ACSP1Y_002564 [Aeromonas hydrophila]